jgi:hypothetical protein
VQDLTQVDIETLIKALEPDSLLERFAARKENGMAGSKREFM